MSFLRRVPLSLRWIFLLLVGIWPALLAAADTALPPGIRARPFEPRSGPRGATLFKILTPEETGVSVENTYGDPKMWGEKYREFTLGAIGTGVAIGDFDGDGKPDIFVVSKTEKNHLFRNLGGFRFEDVTDRAGVGGPVDAWKTGVSFVDINNDGRLDIYVCRFGAPNLLYINQGDGTFKEMAHEYGLDIVDASGGAAFADYDRDGKLDLYLQTNLLDAERHPNGQRDHLYHNNGDGTFTDVTDRAGIFGLTQGHSATWWDYNNDGWPDLYIANDFKDPDQLYRNNGDGTFTNVLSWAVPHTPHSSMGADLGDINNDGLIDFIVADMAATTRYKDHRGMARVRGGLMDDEEHPYAAQQYMRNSLFLNTGTGHMLEVAQMLGLDATDWTWSIHLEDFDNDGKIDAYFTNGMVRELHNADLTKKMMTVESSQERIRMMKASPVLKERHLAYRNLGDLHFQDVSAEWGLDQVGVAFGSALGDLDGDGDLDIVYLSYQGNVTICRNDSDTGHRAIIELRGTLSNDYGVGATVHIESAAGQQVRQLVLLRGYLSTGEPILHFGLGNDTEIKRMTVNWPSGAVQVFEHLAVDQRFTITEPSDKLPPPAPPKVPAPSGQFVDVTEKLNLSLISPEHKTDEYGRTPLQTFRYNRPGPALAFADVDGDGEDDLCLGGASGERGQVLTNLGGGQFMAYGSSMFGAPTAVPDGAVLFFDAHGTGLPDLLVTKGGDAVAPNDRGYRPRLFYNDGQGRFSKAPDDALPDFTESALTAIAADFDHDGHLDVFVGGRLVPGAYPTSPRSALWANRDGKFVDVTDEIAPGLRQVGMVTSALWTDVDGDGWPDLLLTTEWGGIHYFHNEHGKKFTDLSDQAGFSAAGHGWWTSVNAADLNGDGRLDYVVGNVGTNTAYHADPAHPAMLYYGDVEGNGHPQIIETQFRDGKLYPLRGLQQLVLGVPSVLKRFPNYESYAGATFDQVFPADQLARLQKYSATEFRSGVFMSQPDGTYRFEPLPQLAQIAPIYGMAVGDFDGDGHADILLVQNSYAPIAEIGRFDSGLGLLIKGDGHGGLTALSAQDSGVVVPHDAKALSVVDLDQDGWPDFVVSRNNDFAIAFRNRRAETRNSFGVLLKGPKGNPTGVGARVRARHQDGSSQLSEVHAGASYLSQSTATQFFGYTNANPVVELEVTWPDGSVARYPCNHPKGRLVLSPPAP